MSPTAPSPAVITEALGGSPLSLAIQERRLPSSLQPWSPSGAQEWADRVARVREHSGGWYDAVHPAIAPSRGGAAAERLARVVSERGVLVTTGQQAGLFGGPLYTLSKAMTALAMADTLETQTGVPVAPVFWAATDDADFLEASIAHVADGEGEGLRELRLRQAPAPGTTMADTPLARAEMTELVAQLRRSCGSAPHERFLRIAVDAFTEGATLGGAYVAFLRALLEPLGIAVLDASHAAYRAAARPLLHDALTRAADIEATLAETSRAVRAAGFEVQVQDDRGLSLVFEIAHGVKRRLPVGKPAGASRELSPNVLLRPIVEREILPTVAYVGGPAEIAYFVQSNAVSRCLDRDPLVAVPRWSCTIVQPFARRAVERLGVDWRDVQHVHDVERRLAAQALPPDVAASWKSLRDQVHRAVAEYRQAVERHDLLPAVVLDGLERTLDHRLSRGERRLLAAVKRRQGETQRDLAIASAALFPLGKRQERVLNYVPMLARGGGGDALLGAMRAAAAQHVSALVPARRATALASP